MSEDAERVLAPLRSFGPPLADGIRKQDYGQVGAMAPDVNQLFAPASIDIAGEKGESRGCIGRACRSHRFPMMLFSRLLNQLKLVPV